MAAGRLTGAVVGVFSGFFVGALLSLGAYNTSVKPDPASFFGLMLPLAVFGYLYDTLVAKGLLGTRFYFETVFFWAIAFPPSKLFYDLLVRFTHARAGYALTPLPDYLRHGGALLAFLLFQGMVGGVYGIGFSLLHRNFSVVFEAVAAKRLRFRVSNGAEDAGSYGRADRGTKIPASTGAIDPKKGRDQLLQARRRRGL